MKNSDLSVVGSEVWLAINRVEKQFRDPELPDICVVKIQRLDFSYNKVERGDAVVQDLFQMGEGIDKTYVFWEAIPHTAFKGYLPLCQTVVNKTGVAEVKNDEDSVILVN